MRLLIITNILTPYRIPLFEEISRNVDSLLVVLMAGSHEDRSWDLDDYEFDTHFLKGLHFRPKSHLSSLHFNLGVSKVINDYSPDVILSGGNTLANLEGFIFSKIKRIPYIGWGELILNDVAASSWIRRIVRYFMVRNSIANIASSSESKKAFEYYGSSEADTHVSIMPVDVKKFASRAESFYQSQEYNRLSARFEGPILLSVGRLIDIKGYYEMFDAFRALKSVYKGACLLILGDGVQSETYKKYVEDQSIDDIHFLGFVQSDDLFKYFCVANVFIFHTLRDPFGAVLSEAMACRTLCVSSIYASSTKEFVEDGVTGFSIDPRNTIEFVDKIEKALELNEIELEVVKDLAQNKVMKHDFSFAAKEIVDICAKYSRNPSVVVE